MTYRNPWVIGAILALVIAASMTAITLRASANPFEFLVENQGTSSVTATTTITYMTAGLATTTTNVFDSYSNGQTSGYATNNASLEIQFVASSTSSIFGWYYEYAQGGPGANCVNTPASCDWYADDQQVNTVGSTTPGTYALSSINKFNFTFASSSQGAAAILSTNNLANRIVSVPVPTRYVRAVFFMPPGSAAGGIWAAFVGQKQSAGR